MNSELLPLEAITQRILALRGKKVLLDADLATLYGVETRRLNEQVRRNLDRFPEDFIFEVTNEEVANLKSHFATSSQAPDRLRHTRRTADQTESSQEKRLAPLL